MVLLLTLSRLHPYLSFLQWTSSHVITARRHQMAPPDQAQSCSLYWTLGPLEGAGRMDESVTWLLNHCHRLILRFIFNCQIPPPLLSFFLLAAWISCVFWLSLLFTRDHRSWLFFECNGSRLQLCVHISSKTSHKSVWTFQDVLHASALHPDSELEECDSHVLYILFALTSIPSLRSCLQQARLQKKKSVVKRLAGI